MRSTKYTTDCGRAASPWRRSASIAIARSRPLGLDRAIAIEAERRHGDAARPQSVVYFVERILQASRGCRLTLQELILNHLCAPHERFLAEGNGPIVVRKV